MGLGDRLKDLRKQAQDVVADHKEQIQGAVEVAGATANRKTHGKYAAKISKYGEKAVGAVDKLGGADAESPKSGSDPQPAAEADAGPTSDPAAHSEPPAGSES